MVFYRKYRPQTIDELDNDSVRASLFAVLSSANIPHAFLFTGPKGLGKTSTARIIAKAVNCEKENEESGMKNNGEKKKKEKNHNSSFIIHNSSSVEPCNECDQCISITNGTNVDVIEIDGASNRGIDEIRDLREKIRLSPAAARKKVYIIDEVHMLTTEAFNALLKTLEEPPAHVLFVLCTTEPHKVPGTILSRCFHLSFTKATTEELLRSFSRIVEKEGIVAEGDVLIAIAELSDGSFRDGTKILEEVALLAGKSPLTRTFLESHYQGANTAYFIKKLLVVIEKKDLSQALGIVSEAYEKGEDMKFLLEQLINTLHTMLLSRVGVGDTKEQKTSLSVATLKTYIERFTKAYLEVKYAVISQLPLELALIDLLVAQDGDAQKKEPQKEEGGLGGKRREKAETQPEKNLWQEFVQLVNKQNRAVAGVLRGCRLKEATSEAVLIEAGFPFHKDRLQDAETHKLLEQVWKDMTGNSVQVTVLLKDKA